MKIQKTFVSRSFSLRDFYTCSDDWRTLHICKKEVSKLWGIRTNARQVQVTLNTRAPRKNPDNKWVQFHLENPNVPYLFNKKLGYVFIDYSIQSFLNEWKIKEFWVKIEKC